MDPKNCFPYIVEDDADFRHFVVRAFRKAGVPAEHIREAGDAGEAIACLRSPRRPRVSLLVVDLHLPGATGLEILEQIRTCEPLRGVPAFLLSDHQSPGVVVRALELGARSYFIKPSRLEELQAIVEGMLAAETRGRMGRPFLDEC